MKFAPAKYDLAHFTRQRNPPNQALQVSGQTIPPSPAIRILGVHLDTKLNWRAHARIVKNKLATQALSLSRTVTATWGANLNHARTIYKGVILALTTFGALAWHNPSGTVSQPFKEARSAHNKGARRIGGAYKATPIPHLEVEIGLPPMDLLLTQRVLSAHTRTYIGPASNHIALVKAKINRRLLKNKPGAKQTPAEQRKAWIKQFNEYVHRGPNHTEFRAKEWLADQWQERWDAWRRDKPRRGDLPNQINLKETKEIGKALSKAESSLLIQMRTEVIGLGNFLAKRNVPNAIATCACGLGRETAQHLVMDCPREQHRRAQLPPGTYREKIRGDARTKLQTVRWALDSGRFHQFDLARRLQAEDDIGD